MQSTAMRTINYYTRRKVLRKTSSNEDYCKKRIITCLKCSNTWSKYNPLLSKFYERTKNGRITQNNQKRCQMDILALQLLLANGAEVASFAFKVTCKGYQVRLRLKLTNQTYFNNMRS